MRHVIYINNVNYPHKAIVVNGKNINLSQVRFGVLMYFDLKTKKYRVVTDNKCDISSGGLYAGSLNEK